MHTWTSPRRADPPEREADDGSGDAGSEGPRQTVGTAFRGVHGDNGTVVTPLDGRIRSRQTGKS